MNTAPIGRPGSSTRIALALLLLLPLAPGCQSHGANLLDTGFLELDVAAAPKFEVEVDAHRTEDGLLVHGTVRAYEWHGLPRVEVALVGAGGRVIARRSVAFGHEHLGRRTRCTFRVTFDAMPPTGTTVRVRCGP